MYAISVEKKKIQREVIKMPGFDGTGPNGMGSMTGGGRGFCAIPLQDVQNRPFGVGFYGRGRGFGRGLGRGFGRGRGRGFGMGWASLQEMRVNPYLTSQYPSAEFTSREESKMLKEQAKFMQEEINLVNQRIRELESAKSKEEDKE